VPRRWLAAVAICGLWVVHPAPAARSAPVPARVAAIGQTASLAPELRRAFDYAGFEPTPEPGPDDWLAQHP